MIIKNKFASTYANFVLEVKDIKNINYLYYLLKINKNNIMDLAKYSVKIGHIQYEKLSQLKLKLPKNKQLIQDLEPVFQQIEALQNDTKLAEQLYKQLIQELSNEAIPNSQQLTTQSEEPTIQLQENDTEEPTQREDIQTQGQENEIEKEPEPVLVPKKIKKTVKKTKSVIIEQFKEQDKEETIKEPETLEPIQETTTEHVQEQELVLVPKKIKKIVKKLKIVIKEQDKEQDK